MVTTFQRARVPYALVGGQAVAAWVATKDLHAVRTTKNVDVLLRRADLAAARAAASSVDRDYFEVLSVGMFLDRQDPNPRRAVHIIWAGEKIRSDYPIAAPQIDESTLLGEGVSVVNLPALVRMKLTSNRDQDRVHLRDMIDVGLIGREMQVGLPTELSPRLDELLKEYGK